MKIMVSTLFVVFLLLNGTVLFADSTWVGDTTISGGIWTSENSPICVDGDIRVASLEIKHGVSVIFFGNYKFEVAGVLTAVGTEQDSIIFAKAHPDTVGWQRIWFIHVFPGSELAYCRIEGATNHGIVVDSCQPTIRNCTITNNSAPGGSETGGGGISIHSNLPLTLTDCIISNNSVSASGGGYAFGWGGGIYCHHAPLTLTNCIISNNSVTAYTGSSWSNCYSYGGGIYSDTTLILHKCFILSNSLIANTQEGGSNAYARGGGIWAYRGLTLTNCLIDSNLSSATGSGFNIRNYARGGGIYIIGNSTLKNSIVSCNTSSAGTEYTGAGIYNESGTLHLINCTIASNINQGLKNLSGSVTATNSIFYLNTDAQISGNATVTFSDVQGGYTGEGNIDYNPVFKGDCGSNLIIVPPSPCIDSGNPDPIYNDVCFPPSLGTVRNDMGAHGGPFAGGWLESPTDKPALVSPDYNSSGGVNTTYTWRSVLWATEYQFQLDTSDVGDFVSPVMDTTISDTFYTVSGLDPNEVKGMNWWRVRGKNICDGPWSDPFIYTDVKEENYNEMPSQFSLNQNYPNPFNPETKLEFTLSKNCYVELNIYNILGKKIRTLVNEHLTAGYKTVNWDGKDDNGNEVPTGVYFYRIKAGDFTQAKKMILLK